MKLNATWNSHPANASVWLKYGNNLQTILFMVSSIFIYSVCPNLSTPKFQNEAVLFKYIEIDWKKWIKLKLEKGYSLAFGDLILHIWLQLSCWEYRNQAILFKLHNIATTRAYCIIVVINYFDTILHLILCAKLQWSEKSTKPELLSRNTFFN